MKFDAETAGLNDWVEYIQTLHFREIELSLERVRSVYQRLYPSGVPYQVITISGTNGKGSTAEILSSILRASNYKVGKFSSPHLVDFSERYNISGNDVDEEALLASLQKIEVARSDTPITFFEFGALLAIDLFAQANVDVAVMEVGLGGRLDAINILDADVAAITSISIDHTGWLGDTIEKIGFEKAGIARQGKPCVVGIAQPPQSIIDHCTNIGAKMLHLNEHFSYQERTDNAGREFSAQAATETWSWRAGDDLLDALPLPFSQSGVQLNNAATALMVLRVLPDAMPIDDSAIATGLQAAQLLARCQVLQREPKVVLDVSHNESSVQRLAQFVEKQQCKGEVYAIVGMLFDKEIAASLSHLKGSVDYWRFATIHGERGASAEHVRDQIHPHGSQQQSDKCYESVVQAYDEVLDTLKSDDLLLVFGSFYIAGDILQHIRTLGSTG